jgi:hypothetical protein
MHIPIQERGLSLPNYKSSLKTWVMQFSLPCSLMFHMKALFNIEVFRDFNILWYSDASISKYSYLRTSNRQHCCGNLKSCIKCILIWFGVLSVFWEAKIVLIQFAKEHENSLDKEVRVSYTKSDSGCIIILQPLDLLIVLYKFQVFILTWNFGFLSQWIWRCCLLGCGTFSLVTY